MTSALLAARLLLAAVFAVAGIAKLLDRSGSRQAMRDFGVPERLTAPAGLLLPLGELAVAVLLVPARTAWVAAVAALALLALFIGGIGLTLARGRRPDCHCFGQLHSAPVGWRTIARNGLLAGVAGFILIAGRGNAGIDLLAWLGGDTVAAWVALGLGMGGLIVSAVLLWLLLQMVAQNGRLLARLEGLEQRLGQTGEQVPAPVNQPAAGLLVGTPAPAFQLPGLHGEVLTLEALRASGRPALLAFVDPGCGPCNALLPDLARWQRELAGTVSLAVISSGSAEENRAKTAEHGLSQVLLQQEREVATAYQASGTPGMVLVRPDGSIGSPLAQGAEQIRALVARTLGTPLPQPVIPVAPAAAPGQPCPNCGKVHDAAPPAPQGLPIGQEAPALRLPDLGGNEVDLADFRGRDTALLFWNPGCGFCQQLLPQLKQWEASRPDGAPALLVVSTGTVEANAAHGLASPVLLQNGFAAGSVFGANGTPSAVLVDRAGNVASAVAVGGPAVMRLLGPS
ncbi:MAG TPA: MauE/DoxX family redox-associated membrane protein [Chloroflexota bacterium]